MCYRTPFYIQFLVEKKNIKAAQAESKSAKFRMCGVNYKHVHTNACAVGTTTHLSISETPVIFPG